MVPKIEPHYITMRLNQNHFVLIQFEQGIDDKKVALPMSFMILYHQLLIDFYQVESYSPLLGMLCPDINECDVDNGGCDQECVNIAGSYLCKCWNGYLLADEGTTCVGKLLTNSVIVN